MPSSQQTYSIVEPHPTVVPSKSYVYSGRGGAGNFSKVPSTVTSGSDATGPAARASVISLNKPRRTSFVGRGGAGNIHEGERAMFSFDEELERQMTQERNIAPVYHVGRGGAGNLARNQPSSTFVRSSSGRRDSDSNSANSSSSVESGADVATRKLKEGFRKMTKRGL